jgi:predicted lipoprotein with Yx(FWY)xxD motif
MNKNTTMIAAGVIIVILIIAAGAYYYTTKNKTHSGVPSNTINKTTNTITNTSTINETMMHEDTINVDYNYTVGNYLTNSTDWTLYLFTKDTPNSGNSVCYGGCATAWPPFYSANITVPSGVNALAFNTITRTGGAKQTTYMGWPLYYYAGDKAAFEVNGQGVGGTWWAVTLPKLTLGNYTGSNTMTSNEMSNSMSSNEMSNSMTGNEMSNSMSDNSMSNTMTENTVNTTTKPTTTISGGYG